MIRSFLVALALIAALFLFPYRSEGETADVAVLVHGWDAGTDLGPLSWTPAVPMFNAAGFSTVVVNLPGIDNAVNAAAIRDVINALPADARVHLVGHSMGGISARYYLKNLGGASRVSTYVAIDAPHYGSPKAWLLCWQIIPNSPFLRALNAPDATPGSLPYIQLTVEYGQLLPGVYYAPLSGVTHRSAVADPATIALVIRTLQGDLTGLAFNP